MNLTIIIRCLIYIFLLMVFCGLTGCSESPQEKYIRICAGLSSNQKQMDSCKCMAKEYDKVLNKEEFEEMVSFMGRGVKEARSIDGNLSNMSVYVDNTGINMELLKSAMLKMQPLHKAHVCGYGVK